jgi:hypothetical protein
MILLLVPNQRSCVLVVVALIRLSTEMIPISYYRREGLELSVPAYP